ncbi:hypothetical protein V502_06183 [Pseudogymnoascus sp. VKM F-4520 (FW-2644)]|nr:hypothetical protein V502_06183 [Pseudogymnoascus sp. VKM F-4520 (FW-2644)]
MPIRRDPRQRQHAADHGMDNLILAVLGLVAGIHSLITRFLTWYAGLPPVGNRNVTLVTEVEATIPAFGVVPEDQGTSGVPLPVPPRHAYVKEHA